VLTPFANADRALPLLQERNGHEPCPALYPVTLASVLVAAKNHENRRLPNITTLLASAVRCSGFGQLLVSCGKSAVVDAELWLISHCRLQVLRPFTDDINELVAKLRCACCACCAAQAQLKRTPLGSSDIAPAGGEFIDVQACLCIVDYLYGVRPSLWILRLLPARLTRCCLHALSIPLLAGRAVLSRLAS